MESFKAQKHRGSVPWWGLLLAVSLYIIGIPSVDGKFTYEYHPNALKNPHVTVKLHNKPMHVTRYNWFKGDSRNMKNQIAAYDVRQKKMIPGPAYNYRQSILPDGTLKIINVTKKDTGYYTVQTMTNKNKGTTASIHLFFLEPSTSTTPKESRSKVRLSDAVNIMCLGSLQNDAMHWFFNDHKLRLKNSMALSQYQNILTIMSMKRETAGQYHCMYLNPVKSRTSERLIIEAV